MTELRQSLVVEIKLRSILSQGAIDKAFNPGPHKKNKGLGNFSQNKGRSIMAAPFAL